MTSMACLSKNRQHRLVFVLFLSPSLMPLLLPLLLCSFGVQGQTTNNPQPQTLHIPFCVSRDPSNACLSVQDGDYMVCDECYLGQYMSCRSFIGSIQTCDVRPDETGQNVQTVFCGYVKNCELFAPSCAALVNVQHENPENLAELLLDPPNQPPFIPPVDITQALPDVQREDVSRSSEPDVQSQLETTNAIQSLDEDRSVTPAVVLTNGQSQTSPELQALTLSASNTVRQTDPVANSLIETSTDTLSQTNSNLQSVTPQDPNSPLNTIHDNQSVLQSDILTNDQTQITRALQPLTLHTPFCVSRDPSTACLSVQEGDYMVCDECYLGQYMSCRSFIGSIQTCDVRPDETGQNVQTVFCGYVKNCELFAPSCAALVSLQHENPENLAELLLDPPNEPPFILSSETAPSEEDKNVLSQGSVTGGQGNEIFGPQSLPVENSEDNAQPLSEVATQFETSPGISTFTSSVLTVTSPEQHTRPSGTEINTPLTQHSTNQTQPPSTQQPASPIQLASTQLPANPTQAPSTQLPASPTDLTSTQPPANPTQPRSTQLPASLIQQPPSSTAPAQSQNPRSSTLRRLADTLRQKNISVGEFFNQLGQRQDQLTAQTPLISSNGPRSQAHSRPSVRGLATPLSTQSLSLRSNPEALPRVLPAVLSTNQRFDPRTNSGSSSISVPAAQSLVSANSQLPSLQSIHTEVQSSRSLTPLSTLEASRISNSRPATSRTQILSQNRAVFTQSSHLLPHPNQGSASPLSVTSTGSLSAGLLRQSPQTQSTNRLSFQRRTPFNSRSPGTRSLNTPSSTFRRSSLSSTSLFPGRSSISAPISHSRRRLPGIRNSTTSAAGPRTRQQSHDLASLIHQPLCLTSDPITSCRLARNGHYVMCDDCFSGRYITCLRGRGYFRICPMSSSHGEGVAEVRMTFSRLDNSCKLVSSTCSDLEKLRRSMGVSTLSDFILH